MARIRLIYIEVSCPTQSSRHLFLYVARLCSLFSVRRERHHPGFGSCSTHLHMQLSVDGCGSALPFLPHSVYTHRQQKVLARGKPGEVFSEALRQGPRRERALQYSILPTQTGLGICQHPWPYVRSCFGREIRGNALRRLSSPTFKVVYTTGSVKLTLAKVLKPSEPRYDKSLSTIALSSKGQ